MADEGAAGRLLELAVGRALVTIGKRQLRTLATLLDPDEEPLAIGLGTRAGRWWQEVRWSRSPVLVVATDRRVLVAPDRELADPKLQARVEPMAYDEIVAVAVRRGRLESKLDLTTTSGEVRFTSLPGDSAEALGDAVRRRI